MIAGRYSLESEIGRGGMGIVWRGRDQVLDREVALKRIGFAPGGSSPDLDRAAREARLAAALHHPHVVSVFDLAVDDDEHWLVMEYVESRNLAQIVRDKGPLPPDAAAGLLAQVADALAAAHAAGIVHRDVKPSNILVSTSGDAKIADFGIARAKADATLTQTGMVTGSPAYLAPEIASGEQASPASDAWSLGATLYHALVGRPPYDVGDNVVGAMYRIVHEKPPRVDAATAGWLGPVLEATMATDPAARWSLAQVRDVLRGGPGAPMPPVPVGPTRTLETETDAEDHDGTAVLAAGAAGSAGEPRTEQAPRGSAPPAVPPIAPEPRPSGRRGRPGGSGRSRRVGAWVLAAVVLVAVLVLGIAILNGGDDSPQAGKPARDESPSASDSTKPSPSDQQSAQAGASAADMRSFVEDYLSTVTSDRRSAWKMLTPEFQRQSGGYGSYSGFWGTIESATPGDISADPDRMLVSYGVTYTKKDGSTVSDSVTLQLRQEGDTLLIAGES
ncbi:serine/threonine-protein kinase [Nocardioides marmoribigeumensis]|uniref:non-specific serine/threonine protein kinase n=1 Tax=Nocardioides marmoribigeumensis TaxID=433649 RepID=A0ABU2C0Q6_9ACTN|nr:serine/threonine-protein kinase [Nocardioides marmoribigeumensis]MDR7364204.1 serine/threonine protein kinase [Nocardioides marmoribigeumensis]